MSGRSFFAIMVVLLLGLLVSGSVFTIKESERGIMLRFGKIVDADLKPGLGPKLPIIHEIRRFDGRIQSADIQEESFLTKDKEPLIVDSYAMWRIMNLERFYTSLRGDSRLASDRLSTIISGKLRDEFGERTVDQVISGEREELMRGLIADLDQHVRDELGISIIDVRVKQIERPPGAVETVYREMRAERQRKAQEFRSKGKEIAEGIRAEADSQARVVVAKAKRDSETLRGEGDALATRIYAKAYSADPDFYEFYRSLEAYKATFSSKSDLILLSPDSEFFDFMKQSGSGGGGINGVVPAR
jgi:membrane protease subunit HflC